MLYVIVFVVAGNVRKVYAESAKAADDLMEILKHCDAVESVHIESRYNPL